MLPVPPGRAMPAAERLLTIVGAALVSTGLMLGGALFGVPGVLLTLLVPVPAAWAQMRAGLTAGFGAVLLTAAAALWAGGVEGLGAYLLQFGLVALLLPWLLRRGVAWDRAVAITVLTVVAVAATTLLLVAARGGQSIPQLVDAYVASEVDQARTFLDTSQLPTAQQREMEAFLADFARFLGQAYAGIATVACTLMVLLTVWCLSRLTGREQPLAGPPFRTWKAPEKLVWVLIVAGFLQVFAPGMAGAIGLNLLVVLILVYYLQGLAVVTHLFERRQLPALMRGAAYFLILFVSPLPLMVAGVGLFDLWIDFRKKKIKNET